MEHSFQFDGSFQGRKYQWKIEKSDFENRIGGPVGNSLGVRNFGRPVGAGGISGQPSFILEWIFQVRSGIGIRRIGLEAG